MLTHRIMMMWIMTVAAERSVYSFYISIYFHSISKNVMAKIMTVIAERGEVFSEKFQLLYFSVTDRALSLLTPFLFHFLFSY